jgi:hypothetical protein
MFRDKFFNITDTDYLFDTYTNTVNYVSVDSAYLSDVNFFVRKQFIEGSPS